jgi:3-hydroxyacyl-CoA dehydrogenase
LKVLKAEKGKNVTDVMVEKGWLGNKTKQGFYKQTKVDGKKQFWPLNFETMEHETAGGKQRFDSVGKARDIEDKGERLKVLMAGDDKASELAKAFTYFGLSYAALCIPEIADLPDAIDNAMKWGFVHDAGPFEIWDALGVADAAEKMKAEGYEVAAWVEEMLASGKETFYKYEGKIQTAIYDPIKKEYHPLPVSPVRINLQSLKDAGKEVARNEGASLIDLGDGVACVEFHTKMNVFDTDIGAMLMEGMDIVEKDFDAMVVGNQGPHFSAGANLFLIVMHAQQEQWDELDAIVKGLQDLNMRMRYFPKPIVAAPFGYTLGGGAELMMHCNRVVASAETYTGLVEMGMGLLPAGGGSKEMLRRILNPAMRVENTEPLSFIEKVFLQIGMAKVATSAEEARDFALLLPSDRVVMNQDHLLAEAKREARHMADTGYRPPTREKIYAVGRDGLAAIKIAAWMFGQGGYISEHDALVADRVANVLSGGGLSKAQWVDEQYILDLEREYFLSLCGEKKTQERIWHFLQTGKPLRN